MTLFKKSTVLVKPKEAEADRKWFVLDATGKTLGRFASEVAKILRGKHKTNYTPTADSGDGVIILNAGKIVVTGSKESSKMYVHHTGHIGGLKEIPLKVMRARKPEHILRHAIAGMMPKTRLTDAQLKRLRIFKGAEHDHQAQQPHVLAV
ncbi:MAG: 50S ribosomal protein L13 [Chlamydiae bacterium]|jgi:large subunit ribosomal protein L13|nr:50S ribosomal protein L13 [Chlamydiota bacterium]